MKNKEIVKRLRDSLDYEFDLSFNERRELLSYIEQLENNRDKAIEYVEHHKFNKFGDIDCNEAEDIIDILKGDSE